MALTTILFDLDGTLLPMDQDVFIKSYFGKLAQKLSALGYESGRLIECVWKGTEAMIRNDGSCTNEEAFWQVFCQYYGKDALKDQPVFDAFYRNEFQQVQSVCAVNPAAAHTIHQLQAMGLRLVLATNPLFPAIATESRIRWAGLSTDDFELYTTYENARFCKPNPDYYLEILQKLGCSPQECLMVGNDVDDDMIAPQRLGMKVFLLSDCLINRDDADLSLYPQGSFEELMDYVRSL